MQKKLLLFCLAFVTLLSFPGLVYAQGDLIPDDGSNVFILTGSTYKIESGGSTLSFNGTINGENLTLASLIITGGVTGHETIVLKNVTTAKLEVETNAEVILEIMAPDESTNLGDIVNNGDLFILGALFDIGENEAENHHLLTDSTASLRAVDGEARVIVSLLEGGEAHNSEKVTLPGIVISPNTSEVTFIWQKKDALWWMDLDTLVIPAMSSFAHCYYDVEHYGLYRFRAMVEKDGVMSNIISNQATVDIYHNVTIPTVEGVTTDPEANVYEVKDGESFKFWLFLDPDYNQSEPLVTTSLGDTLNLDMTDYYLIRKITDSQTIHIDNIEPNEGVSNVEIENEEVGVYTANGNIHISMVRPTLVRIYSFEGILLKNAALPAGNSTIAMPAGLYILQAGEKVFKLQVGK